MNHSATEKINMITEDEVIKNAWQVLENSIINYQGQPIGVLAAQEVQNSPLNYDQCFTRDFAVAALAFLMQGKTEIVRNFLCQMIELQNHQKQMDCFQPSQGLMPASFKVDSQQDQIIADFGESAIARVAPVDSGF